MNLLILVALPIVFFFIAFIVALSLCKAAARGDRILREFKKGRKP
jgi:hypothetical protein